MPDTKISLYTRNSKQKLAKIRLVTSVTLTDRREKILKSTKLIRVIHNRKDRSQYHKDGKTNYTFQSKKREDVKTLISKNALSYLKRFNSKRARAEFYYDSANVLIILISDTEKQYIDRQVALKIKEKAKNDAKFAAIKKKHQQELQKLAKSNADKLNTAQKRQMSYKVRRTESKLGKDNIPKSEAYQAFRAKLDKVQPIANATSVHNTAESSTDESSDGSSDEENRQDAENDVAETDSEEE
jgi:hypothetical protein